MVPWMYTAFYNLHNSFIVIICLIFTVTQSQESFLPSFAQEETEAYIVKMTVPSVPRQ